MGNIIEEIVQKRKNDIERLGWNLGCAVPERRVRGDVVPFIAKKGVVLEIKRASPSKGDIAPNLDTKATALSYADGGTSAISVLTETNYFKGTLNDLMAACEAVDSWACEDKSRSRIAILRKDFLIAPEEVDVAYRCGADAVLVIARMLDDEVMRSMVKKCDELNMTAFVELRVEDDLRKLSVVKDSINKDLIVCGVNARDLKDFSIDLLTPAKMLSGIKAVLGNDARVIFESGIRTPMAASFAGSLGFTGMLLGEAAARNPKEAGALVSSFVESKTASNGQSKKWLSFVELLKAKDEEREQEERELSHCAHSLEKKLKKPLLKICGLTNLEDAMSASVAGADFLGFIFAKKSPRCASADVVMSVKSMLKETYPFLVGVITDCSSEEARSAISLAKDGVLDFLQLHGKRACDEFFDLSKTDSSISGLAHFCVVNVESESDFADLENLRKIGEPRILIDAKIGDRLGGTGKRVDSSFVSKIKAKQKLWLAGGITADNVSSIISEFEPELIDVSSGIELEPGKKDGSKLLALVNAIGF